MMPSPLLMTSLPQKFIFKNLKKLQSSSTKIKAQQQSSKLLDKKGKFCTRYRIVCRNNSSNIGLKKRKTFACSYSFRFAISTI